jgi:Arc/MetJ-type ribon-helix-helix transcriptional regulator
MEKLDLELSAEMLEFVTAAARMKGLTDPADYVRRLIRLAQRRKAIRELEQMALRSLDSGPMTPWTSEDTESIIRDLRAKYGNGNGKHT